jgi:hypothetical protein
MQRNEQDTTRQNSDVYVGRSISGRILHQMDEQSNLEPRDTKTITYIEILNVEEIIWQEVLEYMATGLVTGFPLTIYRVAYFGRKSYNALKDVIVILKMMKKIAAIIKKYQREHAIILPRASGRTTLCNRFSDDHHVIMVDIDRVVEERLSPEDRERLHAFERD